MLMRTALAWELGNYHPATSALRKLAPITLLPALLLLPLERGAFFESWLQGAVVFGWLYALMAATTFGASAGLLETHVLWLFQKGVSLTDYSLARLLIAAGSAVTAA